jgi:tripartite-type tricarboxylate transporter receptor subunit TctC
MKIILSIATLALLVSSPLSQANDYPNRPLTFVVPFASGGLSDNIARLTAKGLSAKLGQPVIVENKPGAGGVVGTEYVANSRSDGYTFMFASSGPFSILPGTQKRLSYDPIASFTLLNGIAHSPLIMVTGVDRPYKTLAEFVEYAKRNPGKTNFASVGTGASHHLTGEILKIHAKLDSEHIPYKGSPAALADVMTGTVDFMWDFAPAVKGMIEGGKLRALAVSGSQRIAALPNVPTTAEAGFPDVIFTAWYMVVMPKGVSKDVSDKFIDTYAEVTQSPEFAKFLEETGSQRFPAMTPSQLSEFVKSEIQRIKLIVTSANIPVVE